MNVYDQAHNLQTAIKESEEFKQFDAARQKVSENPQLDSMLKDFREKQMAVQAKQLIGEEVGEDLMGAVQQLYGIIAQDPAAAEYMQCEMRFSVMMKDVYEILSEVVGIETE